MIGVVTYPIVWITAILHAGSMRSFQLPSALEPVPADVVVLLRAIDRAAGGERWYQDQLPQLLDRLREQARIESVAASSAIEGVVVAPERSARIIQGRGGRLRDRSEAELAGYTAALNHLYHEAREELSMGLILHVHRLLYAEAGGGGELKTTDNLVVDRATDRTRIIRFVPVSAAETPSYLRELVVRTNEALRGGQHHPLLVIAAFVLDLLCIHPFEDGNGRVARLLTAWMLSEEGYGVGRYVSIEQLLFETKEEYYEALAQSTDGWFAEGTHSIWPWTRYFLHQMSAAYERFEQRVAGATARGTKHQRVQEHILEHAPGTFSVGDLRRALPGVSDATIRSVLRELRDSGSIRATGTGRGTLWQRLPRPPAGAS